MTMTADDGAAPAPSSFEITARVARYAYDRLSFAGPVYAVALGTTAVWSIGAFEGSLFLLPQHKSAWLVKARFVSRYGLYNIVPSVIWGTNPPSAIVASSGYLKKAMVPTNKWLYNVGTKGVSDAAVSIAMPPKRVLWIKILCALRGAVAGSVVLSNVIALTSLWQRAREDYAERIRLGREPPLLARSSSSLWNPSHQGPLDGCTIRLAGVRSDATELSLHRRGPSQLWPIFEDSEEVQRLVARYGGQDSDRHVLPQVPVYWQVSNGEYSKSASWDGMSVPDCWLYSIEVNNGEKKKLLYLEADATSGGESALSLQQHANTHKEGTNAALRTKETDKRTYRRILRDKIMSAETEKDVVSTAYFDLDLREVAQGFRRLTDLAKCSENNEIEVMRVLLVDPTVVIESGGGRQTSVRDSVQELGLADVIVDARGLVLNSVLDWLRDAYRDNNEDQPSSRDAVLKTVILETPSKDWFESIRSELRTHGYEVIERTEGKKCASPMLVYERSSADTVNTIRQYLDRGIVPDSSKVCALLTCHDGLQEVETLNKSLDTPVGYICSSDIHDKALEWVRTQCVGGVPASKIQEQLDDAAAEVRSKD